MIEEIITQAQGYVSQRYLPWSLAAIGLVLGATFIRVVDHRLGNFFSEVAYDRTALSRRLLKFSGGSGDDYATFSASVTSPSC